MGPEPSAASSGRGRVSGTPSRNSSMSDGWMSPARRRRKTAAVSTTPIFCATAAAIHWFSETPSCFARRIAAHFWRST